jgi:transcriptional regulator with XRE-family HTH domain
MLMANVMLKNQVCRHCGGRITSPTVHKITHIFLKWRREDKMIVKKLREKNNWSQEQLAQFSELSLRTIQRVEAGNKASLETIKSLASVFEVNISKITEEIIMIDKESADWQSEPWFIKFFLHGIKKRAHMLWIEYCLVALGLISWVVFDPLAITTPVAFLGAYLNSKLLAYIDDRDFW